MLRDKRLIALFGVGFALTALVIAAYGLGMLKSLEHSSVDQRFEMRGTAESSKPKDVVLVKIDDVSFSDLNLQWPFPRGAHAALIDRLAADGAKTIVFDVQFTEPSNDPDQDAELIAAVGRAGNVVLATSETAEDGSTRVLGGDDVVAEAGATVGNSIFPEDTGNVIRRFEHSRGGIVTLPVASAERVTGEKVDPSEFDDDGQALIDFYGPPGSIQSYSYSKVLNEETRDGTFKDKIVVVGATSETLQDLHRTPTSGSGQMPGPEIQANAIGTILNGFPLHGSPVWFDVLLILLMGMVTPLASLRFDARGAFAVAIGSAIVFTIGTWVAFDFGWITVFVYPLLALTLTTIAAVGVNYVAASYERERVRDVFARFVSDKVVEQVLKESGEGLKLGGKRINATVVFTDLRSFTTFSEKLPPEEVISILNRYLTEMSDAILDADGTLVSYMGDGIMAVFGAPIEGDDHADRALAASRDMLVRLGRFNEWMEQNGYGKGFRMGLGLNTGPIMSGNVGSERRLEYTAIGDTTNTAARLEGATKGTPYQLFMAESTRDALSVKPDDVVFVEEMPIRGRDEGVRVWGLVEPDAKV